MSDSAPPAEMAPQEEISSKSNKKSTQRLRATAVIVVTIILLAIIILLLRLKDAPAVGTVHEGTPKGSTVNPIDKLIAYPDNPYVSYSYVSSMHVTITTPSPPMLSRAEFIGTKPYYQQYEVYTLPLVGKLTDQSAVIYRQQNPKLYAAEAINSGALRGLLFTRTDSGYSRTAFLTNGGRYTVVSFSTAGSTDQSNAVWDKMFATVAWR